MTSHFEKLKLKNLPKLIVILVLINGFICLKLVPEETPSVNKNEITLTKDNRSIFKIFESITTIFLSGLFDRSFFITTLLAVKYSKCLVIVAATSALSTVGIISVFLGITINKYIDMMWVDFFSIFLFLIFGIKMISEGLKMSENEDIMQLEDGNQLNMADEEKFVNVKSDTAEVELKNNKKTNKFLLSLQIFINVFIFVFASEIGDRSQISTIYLTSNFDKMTVLISVVIGQFLITVLAVFGGIFIAQRVSSKNLTIIAGSTFILFGIFALFLLCYESNFVTGFNPKASTTNHMDDIKAFKIKKNPNQIGLIPEKEKPSLLK